MCENWDQADEGIWEVRGGRQNFTYSRLMCWVAIERAMRIANQRGLPGELERWRAARDEIYRQIMTRGWNEGRGAFVQHYDTDVLDASLLLMPLVKFIAPTDPRWLSTLDAIIRRARLRLPRLPLHTTTAAADGLRGEEGTFSICSFWYVEALARAGRLDEARLALREDAHLRQPPRPVRRGDRAYRRAAGQLPAGVHPPRADQRGGEPGSGPGVGWCRDER